MTHLLFHNDPSLAARVTKQMYDHYDADQVFGGEYWNGEGGCFIGCIAHGNSVERVQELTGLPIMLTRIAESIFEGLPPVERPQFFKDMTDAMGANIGKDVTLVPWLFLYDTVGRALRLTGMEEKCSEALEVLRLKSVGSHVSSDATSNAADAAADAAAAAYAAERRAQATKLLELLNA